MKERAPQLPDGKIESIGVKERPHVMLVKLKPILRRLEKTNDIRMTHQHAFRLACGPGGVDPVCRILRHHPSDGIFPAFLSDSFPIRIETDHLRSVLGGNTLD